MQKPCLVSSSKNRSVQNLCPISYPRSFTFTTLSRLTDWWAPSSQKRDKANHPDVSWAAFEPARLLWEVQLLLHSSKDLNLWTGWIFWRTLCLLYQKWRWSLKHPQFRVTKWHKAFFFWLSAGWTKAGWGAEAIEYVPKHPHQRRRILQIWDSLAWDCRQHHQVVRWSYFVEISAKHVLCYLEIYNLDSRRNFSVKPHSLSRCLRFM